MLQVPPINMLFSTAPLASSARASNLQTQINEKSSLINSSCTISTKAQQYIGKPIFVCFMFLFIITLNNFTSVMFTVQIFSCYNLAETFLSQNDFFHMYRMIYCFGIL